MGFSLLSEFPPSESLLSEFPASELILVEFRHPLIRHPLDSPQNKYCANTTHRQDPFQSRLKFSSETEHFKRDMFLQVTRPQLGPFFVLKFVRSRVLGRALSTVPRSLGTVKVLFENKKWPLMAVNEGHAGTKKGPNWGHVIQDSGR